MQQTLVSVDDRFQRLAKSPVYVLIAALRGVSITFAPFFAVASNSLMVRLACVSLMFASHAWATRLGWHVLDDFRHRPS